MAEAEEAANDTEFLKNVELSLSLGLPAPRILFHAMINSSQASDEVKAGWRGQLEQELDAQGTGCIKIAFQTTGGAKTAYLVLDECGPGHDLTAELDKLYLQIPEARHEEVRHHLGILVYLGRSVYELMISKSQIIKEICETLCEKNDYRTLKIDATNTTLYLVEGGRRVGIYVRFADDPNGVLDTPSNI